MNNDFQHKLYQYEAPPPKGAWEKIAEALEGNEEFAQRLAVFEAEPPQAARRMI